MTSPHPAPTARALVGQSVTKPQVTSVLPLASANRVDGVVGVDGVDVAP